MNLPIKLPDLGRIAAATADLGTTEVQYLQYRKGDWGYGMESISPAPGSLWAVDPTSLETGFLCWYGAGGDNTKGPCGERFADINSPKVIESELPPIEGAEWQGSARFGLVCVTSDEPSEVGVFLQFTTSSKGGTRAVGKLFNLIHQRWAKGLTEIVPVCELATASYKHAKYGVVHTPVFQVSQWSGMEDTIEAFEAERDEAPEPKPPPAPEPPPDADGPRARRFKRA